MAYAHFPNSSHYRAVEGGSAPVVGGASLDVSSGTEVGATTVTVTGGARFTGATGVTVGGVAATGVVVNSDTSITFVTPANASALSSTAADNARDVVITTPYGNATLTGAFSYTSEVARILGALYSSEYRASDPRVALNSGGVSSWPDFGAQGAAVQASATLQPAYNATSWNGGPGITGDGTNDALQATYGASVLPSGGRPYYLIAYQAVALPGTKTAFQLGDGGGTNQLRSRWVASGGVWNWARNGTVIGAAQTEDLNRHLFELGYTASGTNSFVVDGSGNNSGNTAAAAANQTSFSLFASESGINNANGAVAVAIVCNGTPTSQNLTDLRAFLKGANFPGYTGNSLGLP